MAASSGQGSWRNSILAGLANYIDGSSIVSGSVALALWKAQFGLSDETGGSMQGDAGLALATRKAESCPLETIIAIGGRIEPMLEAGNVAGIRRAAAGASSIASICTGAFLLAAAGYLDHKRATTHGCLPGSCRNSTRT